MRINKITILTSIVILIITIGCSSSSQLYRSDDKDKIYSGKLSDSTFISLKQFLATSTNSQLKDTIIIKYDYNNETCWDLLDKKEDNYIKPFIPAHQERIKQVLASRQNISIFDFRKPGQNFNKIKK
ncbi:MAG: hypothetical protein ABIP79_03920 [Chitinophagaceae bacterium]